MKRRNVIHLHAKRRSGAGAHHDDDRAETALVRLQEREADDEVREATCRHERYELRGGLLTCLRCGALLERNGIE